MKLEEAKALINATIEKVEAEYKEAKTAEEKIVANTKRSAYINALSIISRVNEND